MGDLKPCKIKRTTVGASAYLYVWATREPHYFSTATARLQSQGGR